MVLKRLIKIPAVALIWPLLAFGIVLGLGVWGATRLADDSTRHKQAGYGCLVGCITVLAVANATLLSALLVSRRRHQDLLEALLPREVLQSLREDGGPLFGRAAADTPANLLLNMMGDLLEGRMPGVHDVVFIRTALLSNMDVYQPFNLRDTIKEANLDNDVAQSLMRQLGGDSMPGRSRTVTSHGGGVAYCAPAAMAVGRPCRALPSLHTGGGVADGNEFSVLARELSVAQPYGEAEQACESLSNALALILTPQPVAWQDTAGGGGSGGGPDDLTSELAAGLDLKAANPHAHLQAPMPPPSALFVERRTPNASAHGGQYGAMGLLEKAASLLDRNRRRARRASIEGPPVAAVVDLARERDTSASRASLTTFVGSGFMGRQGSTAGNAASAVDRIVSMRPDSQQRRVVVVVPSGVADADNGSGSNAVSTGGGGGADDDSATITTVDRESAGCGGGGGGGAPPLGEALVPRRLSAVWGMLSKRGTGSLGSPRKVSLDGNPERVLGASGGRASPAFGPSSFSVLRASSTQNATGPEASQLAPRRFGLGGGGGGGGHGSPFRTASVRSMAAAMSNGATGAAASAAAAAAAAAAAVAIKRSTPPPPAVIDEVEKLLARADSWQFDSWALHEATQGHSLSALGFFLIQRAGLIKSFRIKPVTLARALRQVEAGYIENPYHNAVHAADVLQTLHVIIHATQLHVNYLDSLGLLATYYAAIVHDYAHPGLTSDFLIATSNPLAVRYNDRSPLENHHCAASFGLLQRPELDFLEPLGKAERASFRKQVIELVLATDMKQHFSIISHFNTVHRLSAYSQQQAQQQHQHHQQQQQQQNAATSPAASKLNRKILRRTFTRALSTINDTMPDVPASLASPTFASGWSEPPPTPVDDTERLLSLQVVLKCADIGHLGEALDVHKRWLGVLEEEFFRQGDRERELGLPISPLFDRAKQGVSKGQVGFYDFVALPLVHALSSAFPGAGQLMKCFMANYNHWRVVDGQAPIEVPSSSRGGGGRRSGQQQQHAAAAAAAAVVASASVATPTRISEEKGGGLGGLLLDVPGELEDFAGGDAKV